MIDSMVIKGARVIDPSQGMDQVTDIVIENGCISKIGDAKSKDKGSHFSIYDAKNLWAVPGFIDMHVHLREPGQEHKETILTGSRAAAVGGFTAICCMPNTAPAIDNDGGVSFVLSRAKEANLVRVYPIAAATLNRNGKEMTEVYQLKKAGAVALSDDGSPISDANVMRRIMEYAQAFEMKVIDHCEDLPLTQEGVMNEGVMSSTLGLKGSPNISESVMVARNILLSQFTNAPIHLAHMSTKQSVDLIRWAKSQKIPVTAETAPHYFSLVEDDIHDYSANYKMCPPLRTCEDVQAIKDGLKDGSIDAIASDHAPHQVWEKDVEFDQAPCGIIGLETSLSIGLHHLVHNGILEVAEWINKMSCNPAKILNLPGGTLRIGSVADITLIDPEYGYCIQPETFQSKSRNTPFAGQQLKGKAKATIVGGRMIMTDGEILEACN